MMYIRTSYKSARSQYKVDLLNLDIVLSISESLSLSGKISTMSMLLVICESQDCRTGCKASDLIVIESLTKCVHCNLQIYACYLSTMSKIDIFFTMQVDFEPHPSSDWTSRKSE